MTYTALPRAAQVPIGETASVPFMQSSTANGA